MINQLRTMYSSFLLYKNTNEPFPPDYKWFITENHEIIGIHEEELSSKEISLLETFLTPYQIQLPLMTNEERKWAALIHENEYKDEENKYAYRFVYFSIDRNQISPIQFKSAICELFGREVPILWENEFEGIIIEEKIIHEDITSYEQIIDVLMSDLYVKIKFLVGTFKNNWQDVHQYYNTLLYAAKNVFKYATKDVLTYINAIPYVFVHQTSQEQSRSISESILQNYIDDEETTKMIKAFVSCNLNVSETAKKLHMHRNSLQYRLERFYENTDLDIRQFHHAMTAYLALLISREHS
ncbi:CdaR family transcriptional regulator [Sporosarcina pasteurii]|uniref:Leucine-rich protein n=1 Tax=Sporosarcina pasteurii TaxID=1474 RepID=A0A380BFW9_SPOPA|nr:helix-turn-helix domain-containing protein [Sporosarcina pasteurii]MDS9472460.1 helix-turn-helix domain-containing protein [Sporosarcina pasteurii]SUI99666.1 Leucine-rich protein [Sporosarcina pasteurii]